MPGRRRRGLLVRLLAVSIVVALCSIAATAWLAAQTTTVAINKAQGQAFADDARIHDTLLGYAATHPDWSGAGPVVQELAVSTGRQIALTTTDRRVIVGAEPLPEKAAAVVDPLAVDPALANAPADRIDSRAVGPFRLTDEERSQMQAAAEIVLACVRTRAGAGSIEIQPNGRPVVAGPQGAAATVSSCSTASRLENLSPTESAALRTLFDLVSRCMQGKGQPNVKLDQSGRPVVSVVPPARGRLSPESLQAADDCLTAARHEQLRPYVAPAALLFVNTPSQASAGFDLSAASRWRIIGVAALVLLVTVLASVLAGVRLVRPLRALTGAAQRMKDGDDTARVRVHGSDEIVRLALAFNEMADSRAQIEEQRKAMVSDIAHELRTPLSNIRGWLEAVQDGVSRPDPALVASLMEEAMLLQHIVDDLQDLAMADAGKLRLHPERVHLADLLGQVVAANKADGITVSVRTENDLEIEADPVRLRQAVGNLVANAVQHTNPGGSVTVIGRLDGEWVVVEVVDTGVGISADDLPHVFDRFWRAEKSRSRQSGGSGLGLAIVRQFAEAHGGTVTAVSEPGRGSTFTLRLPYRLGTTS